MISTCCCHVDVIYQASAAAPAVKLAEQVRKVRLHYRHFYGAKKTLHQRVNTGAGATVRTFSDEI
ncbi:MULTISPECIES: hypothetical protein [Pseudomonas]|uniref:hypothetical protein n=1 Tax=Pseudomonas TaxID=286 RepID=UPI000B15CD10|nr:MULTISPECIES: hypothetical protein [Pseudomonas]